MNFNSTRGRMVAVLLGCALAVGLLAACDQEVEAPATDSLLDERVAAIELTVMDLQSQIDDLPATAPPVIVTVTPEPTPLPTQTIVIPTPTPRASPDSGVPGPLQSGTVATDGGTLNVRTEASLDSEILETLTDGSTVSLTGNETVGATFTWLELTNGGWVASEFITLE